MAKSPRVSTSPPSEPSGPSGLESTLRPGEGPGAAPHAPPAVPEGERYTVEAPFAEGGIGRILRARDERLGRWVALKVLREPGDHNEGRFLTEALVTARLQHPSIVPVYDAGRLSDGEPFYAMKLVQGRPLSERMVEARTLRERLALLPHLLAVADAMAYAHGENIIHRDLKPANVLVGNFGETVVIDWGLAKDLAWKETASAQPAAPLTLAAAPPSATVTGVMLGTPAYMAPEQALGEPVDARADVYALGVILYQLLAGELPYGSASSAELLRKLLSEPPPPLEQRQPGVPEDLQAIVAKAMAREPEHRYPSARELAEDLRRFLTGQLVGAYSYPLRARVRRFVRRYQAVLAVALVAFVVVSVQAVLGVQRILSEKERAEHERDRAEQARQEATLHADDLVLVMARNAVQATPQQALECLGELSSSFERWGAVRTLAARARAQGLATLLRGHERCVNSVAFSPEGRQVATFSDDRTVRLWDVHTGQQLRVVGSHADEAWHGTFLPGGQRLLSVGKDGQLRLWDLETGQARVVGGFPGLLKLSYVSKDGRYAFALGADSTLRGWEVDSGRSLRFGNDGLEFLQGSTQDSTLLLALERKSRNVRLWEVAEARERPLLNFPATVRCAQISPKGEWLAVVTEEGQLWLESLVNRTRFLLSASRHELHSRQADTACAFSLAFSLDGRRLAARSPQGAVWLWDTSTRRLERKLEGPEDRCSHLTFSPDGRWLAAFHGSPVALLWDVESGALRELRGFRDATTSVVFSPDRQHLAISGADGSTQIYPLEHRNSRVLEGHQGAAFDLAFSPQGGSLLSVGTDGTMRLWSLEGRTLAQQQAHPPGATRARFSRDGQHIASSGVDGRLRLWDGSLQELRSWQGHDGEVTALAFSLQGQWLVSGGRDGTVRLWDVASGEGRLLGRHDKRIASLAFSPQGQWIVSGGEEGRVLLWEVGRERPGRVLHESLGTIRSLDFSPDGRWLVAGSHDHTLWVRELSEDAAEGRRVDVGAGGVRQVAFAPEGRTMVSASLQEGLIRRWDVRTGEERPALRGHLADVLRFTFSPEGRRMASASQDGTVRLWDLESGESRELKGHVGLVHIVAFSPDGLTVASAGEDGTVRLWPDELPLEPQTLRTWLKETVGDQPAACNAL